MDPLESTTQSLVKHFHDMHPVPQSDCLLNILRTATSKSIGSSCGDQVSRSFTASDRVVKRFCFDESPQLVPHPEMTRRFVDLVNEAKITKNVLRSPSFFPYPKENIQSLFIRDGYKGIYKLFKTHCTTRKEFALYGSSGIGKSSFFVYLLLQLVKELGKHPYEFVLYQSSRNELFKFDMKNQRVFFLKTPIYSIKIANAEKTLHVFDSEDEMYRFPCPIFFISCSRPETTEAVIEGTDFAQYLLPVWLLDELEACN